MKSIIAVIIFITCQSASAMLNANTTVAPDALHVEANAVHVEPGALQLTGTGTIQPGAITVQPGAITATVQAGAFSQPLVSAPLKFDAPITVDPGAVQVTVQPKGFSINLDKAIEIQPGAVVIKVDASLLGDNLNKPVASAVAAVEKAYENRHEYEVLFGCIIGVLIVLCWFLHVRGKQALITQLKSGYVRAQ